MFVISGGGSGIGRALALALAARHQQVLITGRRPSPLLETASQASGIQTLVADVSTTAGRDKITDFLRDYPKISALVNNAGIIEPIAALTEISLAAWQQTMATHVEAPLFLTQALYSKLKGEGRVLNIGSGAAYFPIQGWAAYCVSKAALSMLTRSWQLESQDVAVASVMPGIIDTAMQAFIRQTENMTVEKQDFFKHLKQENRLLSPETVAEFLCWLLLDIDQENYLSGEWDIYDSTHHSAWLKPPHRVPAPE